ncbi:hypothetical protein [Nitrosophilus alvini]|uniref:hypothetical protein n=1 Tax=Nitrosophilus alvini TaxID=2714855 RepID=UPI00190B99A2|nr:hypothetical protein [Nitrosophilus alvini]
MINFNKAATLVKSDGLFTFIYNELKEIAKKEELCENEIIKLLKKHPELLDEYKSLNTQSEITNIQLKEHKITEKECEECKKIKLKINKNIPKLRALETFEKPADNMIYAIWIGSLTAFMIFVVHNIIVLYTFWYENHPNAVFGMHASLIIGGFFLYKNMLKKHEKKHNRFIKLYNETKELINIGLSKKYFTEDEIYE